MDLKNGRLDWYRAKFVKIQASLHSRLKETFPILSQLSESYSRSLSPCCLSIDRMPDRGQQVVDQLLPGSGAQHALKDTDGLAALGMGREPVAGADTGSREKTHSGFDNSLGVLGSQPPESRFGVTSLRVLGPSEALESWCTADRDPTPRWL